MKDCEQTIISGRPPVPPASAVSDSVFRIMQGIIKAGDHLGPFELTEYVGGGGMGRVFRGFDTHLARPVALKVLSPEQAADDETLRRFQNEAQSAARLDHENIARVYYVGEDRGVHFIVFEFIEGTNVRELVEQNGPLPLAQAVSYTLQVAEALAHAASRDVVHRDIKPSNVLITPEGRVKLIDMGLARLKQADPAAVDLTASGVTLGTFDYISPEQARDPRNADVRSDIYSLGCSFFYMLAGRPPFPEGTVLQKLLQHQGDQPPDVRQFRPELPDEVARVLRKMLAKDPRHRYPSPGELVDDLLSTAENIGLQPVGPGGRIWVVPKPPTAPALHRHLPWLAPAAALLCIVLFLQVLGSSEAQRHERQPTTSSSEWEEGGVELPPRDEPSENGDEAEGDAPVKPSGASMESDEPGEPAPAQRQPEVARGKSNEPNGAASGNLVGPRIELPFGESPGAAWIGPWDPSTPERPRPGTLGLDLIRGGISITAAPLGLDLGPEGDVLAGRLSPAPGVTLGPPVAGVGPEAAPNRTGLLIVGDGPEGENKYATLGAACSAAGDHDVIELRFNGPREERPIQLTNVHVTICAGKGYQPLIVFRPVDPDPVSCPRSMFTLTGGDLALLNLAVEFHVPREVPADNWSLLEMRGPQAVRLDRCSLTVRNAADQLGAYQEEVAFLRIKSAAGDNAPAATSPATVKLTDCTARGEAVFLRAEDQQSVHLTWENGLLVTTERLLSVAGSQETAKPGDTIRLELRHLTAVVRDGLCLLTDNQLAPHQLTTQIHCENSILLGSSGRPLIEQEGVAGVEALRRRLAWTGVRNFYQGFDVFWSVDDFDLETRSEKMNFDAWQAHWTAQGENRASREAVVWKKTPEPDRALSLHTSGDYTLSDAVPNNPAIGAASDLRNAGCQPDRLPPLPAPTAAGKPATEKLDKPKTPTEATPVHR